MVGLINKRAIVQVLGCLLNKPDLLDTYYIEEIDVDEDFYVYILNTIKVLHKQNVPVIDAFAIDSYLSSYHCIKTQNQKFLLSYSRPVRQRPATWK